MENTSITIQTILAFFGGVSVIGGGLTVIIKMLNPFKILNEKVKSHDTMLENDNKRLKSIEETNKVICKSMFALLDHEITGNSIEKLKNAKQDMQEYLIGR